MANPSNEVPKGIVCPKCGCRHFEVAYTRPKPGLILRARDCRHCGRRIITREQISSTS